MPMTATHAGFQIRTYETGDEVGQVAIYNAATRALPGFKAATVEDVQRRYRASDFDAGTKFYAVQDGQLVGYASFSNNGRVSVPWCLAEAGGARAPLMEAMLKAMRHRGHRRAWAAYRADWTDVRSLFESLGFRLSHEVTNFVSELSKLPREPVPPPLRIEPVTRQQMPEAYALDNSAFTVTSPEELAEAWMDGPYISSESCLALRDESGRVLGVGLAIVDARFADPTKIDSAMPCFRLGALRTETERTKRVNGLFSYVARPQPENYPIGRWLLSEACRRFEAAGLMYAAAQCPGDRPVEMSFFRTYFQEQKSFPIFAREL